METALYFPYIRVPKTPWFTQVLLYWDQAASIVPRSFRDEEDGFDPYMRDLHRAGLLQWVSPDHELWEGEEAFSQTFLSLIGSRPPQPSVKRFVRVHTEKMSYVLFLELQKRGLAQFKGGLGPESWWRVEVSTANLFMAYLASVMSAASPGMIPVTDRTSSIGTLAGHSETFDQKLAALRYRVITEALPAPRGPVPAAELKDFKEKNADQLLRCRRFLDNTLVDLTKIADPDELKVRTDQALQTISDNVAELREQMQKKKWPGVSLVGFGGVMGAALTVAPPIASGDSALSLGLGVGAGILQLATAGHDAVEMLKRPRYDRRSPLAYAALASRLE